MLIHGDSAAKLKSLPNNLVSDDVLGGYSKYFNLDKIPLNVREQFPFLIVPKASKREKNEGLEDLPTITGNLSSMTTRAERERGENHDAATFKNHHPTVKPLQLMCYLVTLGSRQGDTVLDPFLGSGTTAIACKLLNRRYIGIEREKEYLDIAKARLAATPDNLFQQAS